MKRICLLLLLCALPAMAQIDPGPLERHLHRIEAGIHSLGSQSFVRQTATGEDRYVVSKNSVSDYQYDRNGDLQMEWTLRHNGALQYEAFYSPRHTKERLLDDDRTISYSSFYRNGRPWEQYQRNKEKRLRSYYVYDEQGHLLKTDF